MHSDVRLHCALVRFPCLVQIINGADILEVLHDYPELRDFVMSLYNCQYDQFFRTLGERSDSVVAGCECL